MIKYTKKYIEQFDGTEVLVSILAEDGENVFWIPIDEGNVDYQEYLAWVEENK